MCKLTARTCSVIIYVICESEFKRTYTSIDVSSHCKDCSV